jgi:uncharacterized protein (TIGR02996 family)
MEAFLLQAIQANPADELARQALADWLEERGDPRGELLRLSLALLQRPDSADHARRETQQERLQALLAERVVPCVPTFHNSIGMQFALIPPGWFVYGSPEDEEGRYRDERKQREVEIRQPFYLGVFAVTQEQYRRVMGVNPSWFAPTGGGRTRVAEADTRSFPVEQVSPEDAEAFCLRLSLLPEEQAQGRVYRLPSEVEWEYACRAGTTTTFYFGPSLCSTQANFDGDRPYGGAAQGSNLERTCAVGSYPPNAFGLHDMHGNVDEWCSDQRGNPYDGFERVLRGGSWCFGARYCRAAYSGSAGNPNCNGFRVACDVVSGPQP